MPTIITGTLAHKQVKSPENSQSGMVAIPVLCTCMCKYVDMFHHAQFCGCVVYTI